MKMIQPILLHLSYVMLGLLWILWPPFLSDITANVLVVPFDTHPFLFMMFKGVFFVSWIFFAWKLHKGGRLFQTKWLHIFFMIVLTLAGVFAASLLEEETEAFSSPWHHAIRVMIQKQTPHDIFTINEEQSERLDGVVFEAVGSDSPPKGALLEVRRKVEMYRKLSHESTTLYFSGLTPQFEPLLPDLSLDINDYGKVTACHESSTTSFCAAIGFAPVREP